MLDVILITANNMNTGKIALLENLQSASIMIVNYVESI